MPESRFIAGAKVIAVRGSIVNAASLQVKGGACQRKKSAFG